MSVLVIAESYFGNTHAVAEIIAAALAEARGSGAVTVVRPPDAPTDLPAEIDLLIVGAPTHDYSLPKEQTRRGAARRGATVEAGIGLREWIQRAQPRPDLRAISFDTSIKTRFTPGTAAKAAAKSMLRRGFTQVKRGPSFYVVDTAGPLADGEERRAREWAVQLAPRQ